METNYSDNGAGWEKGSAYEIWVGQRWSQVYNGGTRQRALTFYESRDGQYHIGETRERVEIKNDNLIDKYQRLCIETHEKSNENNAAYVESGILRIDNTVLYLIGDYKRWWLFSKEHLQWLLRKDPPFLFHYKTRTSIGYCLPVRNANRVCLDYVEFNEDGNIRDDSWYKF